MLCVFSQPKWGSRVIWQLMQALITSGECAGEKDQSVARRVWRRLLFWEWHSWYLLEGGNSLFLLLKSHPGVLHVRVLRRGSHKPNLGTNTVGEIGDCSLVCATLQLPTTLYNLFPVSLASDCGILQFCCERALFGDICLLRGVLYLFWSMVPINLLLLYHFLKLHIVLLVNLVSNVIMNSLTGFLLAEGRGEDCIVFMHRLHLRFFLINS